MSRFTPDDPAQAGSEGVAFDRRTVTYVRAVRILAAMGPAPPRSPMGAEAVAVPADNRDEIRGRPIYWKSGHWPLQPASFSNDRQRQGRLPTAPPLM